MCYKTTHLVDICYKGSQNNIKNETVTSTLIYFIRFFYNKKGHASLMNGMEEYLCEGRNLMQYLFDGLCNCTHVYKYFDIF